MTMVLTTLASCIIPASAETVAADGYVEIYSEDFENYVLNKEWLPAIKGTASATTNGKVASGDAGFVKDGEDPVVTGTWGYSFSKYYNQDGSGASVKPVVLSGHEDRGQVLAITGPVFKDGMADGTATNYWINIRRNVGVNSSGTTKGIDRSAMPEGKKIVLEVKYLVPTGSYLSEASFMSAVPEANKVGATNYFETVYSTMSTTGAKPSFYTQSGGKYGYIQARKLVSYNNDVWHTLRIVVDTSKTPSVAHSDTTRSLMDDYYVNTAYFKADSSATGYKAAEVPTSGLPSKWYVTDHPTYPMIDRNEPNPIKQIDFLGTTHTTSSAEFIIKSDDFVSQMDSFFGTHFSSKARTEGKDKAASTYYLDDLKAYYIDALDFTVTNASAYSGGVVTLTFNQELKEEFYEYIENIPTTSTEKAGVRYLKDMFTMIDSTGKVVDGIEEFKLSADKKVVTIKPSSTLAKDANYQIVINPLLIDKYGQGLNKNGHNNPTYVDLYISSNFVPFEVKTLSQEEVSGFAQGRTVEITAEFTKALKDDSVITSGIVVTNTDDSKTVARNNGWTAQLSDDKKTITFNFTNLPTANYVITANDNFVDETGSKLESAFEIKLNAADDITVLFDEDFDTDYTLDKNWICAENKVTTGFTSSKLTSFVVGGGDWNVQRHWTTKPADGAETFDGSDDFVGVVKAPTAATKMSGNVLKIYNNRGTSYTENYVAIRRNFDGANGIDFTDEKYAGKKLVYEGTLFADHIAGTTSFLLVSPKYGTIRDYNEWKNYFSENNGRFYTAGAWQSPFKSYGPLAMYSQMTIAEDIFNQAVDFKFVITKGENVDTEAIYINGNLLERPLTNQAILEGHEYNDSARHELVPSDVSTDIPFGQNLKVADVLYGIWGGVSKSGGTAPAVMYLDNFKAYLVDEFKVETVTGNSNIFNAKTGEVVYTFTKPVALSTKDNVVLLNAEGKEVKGGIKSVTLSEGDYKMTVKLDETKLSGNANYTIRLTTGLRDTDGLTLSTEYKYYEYPIDNYYSKVEGTENVYLVTDVSKTATHECTYTPKTATTPAYLTKGSYKVAVDTWVRDAKAMKMDVDIRTTKSTSVYAEAAPVTIANGKVTTSVTITNPESTPKTVWCIIAAFGEVNQMLGCQTIVYKEGIAGSTAMENIPVSFDITDTNVEYVRMFLWNSKEEMVSYQRAEDIPSK